MAHFLDAVILVLSAILVLGGTSELNENFVKNNELFTLKFYDNLSKLTEPNKSFVVSPYSIQTAGALLFAGSVGSTAEQMYNGLNLISMNSTIVGTSFQQGLQKSSNNSLMKILNKIYLMKNNTIEPKFEQIATEYYQSTIENIDFEQNMMAAKTINDWVSQNTNKKIENLITADDVDADTKMFLLNAIHFKGEWQHKFNVAETRIVDFWRTPEKSVKVNMMSMTDTFKFANFEELGSFGIELPFKDSDLSLFVLKPKTKASNIHELEKNLRSADLKKLFNSTGEMKVLISIPKFTIKTSVDLQPIFEKMNMGNMFGGKADFTKLLSSGEAVSVSKAIHKAFIEINEDGAEAAAVTGITITFRTGPFHLNLNQPFIYFIKGSSNEVYFMGRFMGE